MSQSPSSNDPSYIQEQIELAKQRMARTVQGIDAGDVSFFAETSRDKVSSSNDADHLQSMADIAKAKYR